MTPIDVKQYLLERKLVTLQDIAIHFRTEADTVAPMVEMWIRKGKVKKHDSNLGCRKGCCDCDPSAIVAYEWID
jgi:hypothetical protein